MDPNALVKKFMSKVILKGGTHSSAEKIIGEIPPEYYGKKVDDIPYTLWKLMDHIRFSMHDILIYIKDPNYVEPKWPDDYWPKTDAPTSQEEWDTSHRGFLEDLEEVKRILTDPEIDLFTPIPHGVRGHTIFREMVLITDHNAYHLGQMVTLRRKLGIWN